VRGRVPLDYASTLAPTHPRPRPRPRPRSLYATSEHGIFAETCFATAIQNNYIEDFGRNDTAAPRVDSSSDATASRYYGIGCRAQGGASTVISNNNVYRFADTGGGKPGHGYRDAEFVYIGVDRVNYDTGVVSVLGNLAHRDDATASDIGLWYSVGGGDHGQGLELLSSGNQVRCTLVAKAARNGTSTTRSSSRCRFDRQWTLTNLPPSN
jgi:hypothetical protein